MRASAFGWRAACPAPWGEPARPGFPPEGETGKGELNFLAAAGLGFAFDCRHTFRLAIQLPDGSLSFREDP